MGDFEGNADYLYQGDVLAGNPKIFAQLVQHLAPLRVRTNREQAVEQANESSPQS
jgi:hypothetical protein